MPLQTKRPNEIIPQYSLTGDLLSFLRCNLQYRYHSGSALPPSRPVQLWFGEFIHGVLEAAYRVWLHSAPPFPWPSNVTAYRVEPDATRAVNDIGAIGDTVEATLSALGKNPRSRAARDSAYKRATNAVNELGPHLFPLISAAEERVIGTRHLPQDASLRARLYELHGIIDVLTDIQLSAAIQGNVIHDAIRAACPGLSGRFEVIVDYKGSRRPSTDSAYWYQGDWQIQTYAWLRMRQPHALPARAGVLIYINELSPGGDDIANMIREIRNNTTDIAPLPGTPDAYAINTWRPGAAANLSLEFRLRRALRVIPVTQESQSVATTEFDNVVRQIEACVANEAAAGSIITHWRGCGNDETCDACDFRHFCPSPGGRQRDLTSPEAP